MQFLSNLLVFLGCSRRAADGSKTVCENEPGLAMTSLVGDTDLCTLVGTSVSIPVPTQRIRTSLVVSCTEVLKGILGIGFDSGVALDPVSRTDLSELILRVVFVSITHTPVIEDRHPRYIGRP
jgi:hypothetical protein